MADFEPYEDDCSEVESVGGYKRGDVVRALVDDDEMGYFEGDEGTVSGFGRISAVTDPESIAIRAQFGQSAGGRDYMVVSFEGMDPTEVDPDNVEPA